MSYIDLPNEFPVVEQISRKYNRLPASLKRPHSRYKTTSQTYYEYVLRII